MAGITSATGLVNLPLATSSGPVAPVQQQDLESAPIFTLPSEIVGRIMQYICLKDIVAFRSTCGAMSKIQYIPHRGSEQVYAIQDVALRRKIFKQIRTLHILETLGIRPDIAHLIRACFQKRIPVAKTDLTPFREGAYIYARREVSCPEEGYETILVGKSNLTNRPFVDMMFHVAYTLSEPTLLASENFHKVKGYHWGLFRLSNIFACTLFQRHLSEPHFYCVGTDNHPIPEWYWRWNATGLVPTEDFPVSSTLMLPIIEAVMSDAHRGLHRAYPIHFNIRAEVQRSMLTTCFSAEELVSKETVCATFTAAQIVADYVDPSKKCRRCEVQEAMKLTALVQRDDELLPEKIYHKQLRGVLDIYQLIDEYAGHVSKRLQVVS